MIWLNLFIFLSRGRVKYQWSFLIYWKRESNLDKINILKILIILKKMKSFWILTFFESAAKSHWPLKTRQVLLFPSLWASPSEHLPGRYTFCVMIWLFVFSVKLLNYSRPSVCTRTQENSLSGHKTQSLPHPFKRGSHYVDQASHELTEIQLPCLLSS